MKLTRSFYTRPDVIKIARELIGKHLFTKVDGRLTGGIITETEAYAGFDDRASHAFGGRRTARNEMMYADGGTAYVYICYGIHSLFNVVTNKKDVPHAVLIRAVHPTHGIEEMLKRRKMDELRKNLSGGPGTVGEALGIHISHSGLSLLEKKIWIEDKGIAVDEKKIAITKRIGVESARESALLPYRFVIKVGRPYTLIHIFYLSFTHSNFFLMSTGFPKLILKPKKERSLLNSHPWLFSGAIEKKDAEIKEGDIIEIFSHEQKYLATAHYHEGSIMARIFSFVQTDCGYEFWKEKIANAFLLRRQLGFTENSETNVYRLVNAEGDGVPGLIIDIYNTTAVIQTHTLGMHRIKNFLVDALKEVYGTSFTSVFDKSADTMSKQQASEVANGFLYGKEDNVEVIENGIRFFIDFETGQKTGFFIDQRENRKLLSDYSKGKKVLNTFAYSGGFSLYALKAGAEHVHSVDSSKKAAELAEKNISLNFNNPRHEFFAEDVFDFLKKSETVYDVIVLDPPAFAKHLSSVDKATIGYRNLNFEAIKRIQKNGILFTFSCSQVIDKTLFRKIVFMAAVQAKRNVRILHQLSQPADHPISIYHPEGEYLKGLVLHVE